MIIKVETEYNTSNIYAPGYNEKESLELLASNINQANTKQNNYCEQTDDYGSECFSIIINGHCHQFVLGDIQKQGLYALINRIEEGQGYVEPEAKPTPIKASVSNGLSLFEKLSIADAMLMTQVLNAAAVCADEMPILFCLTDNQDVPTQAQTQVAREIISYCVGNQTFYPYDDEIITILNSTQDHINTLIDGRDTYETEEDVRNKIRKWYGIDYTRNTQHKINYLIKCARGDETYNAMHNVNWSDQNN